jgi:two-component system sensor histidine kinase/response regulator
MKQVLPAMKSIFIRCYRRFSLLLRLPGNPTGNNQPITSIRNWLVKLLSAGITDAMDDYEKRKIAVFNKLNFFQLITGAVVPVTGVFYISKFSLAAWLISCLPSVISSLVIIFNSRQKFQAAFFCYFIFYPVLTCLVYLNGINTGYELSFVLYGILSVFFLQNMGFMLFAINLSMISYFVMFILWKENSYLLKPVNDTVYLANELLAIGYIFFALHLIKRENTDYQLSILASNRKLHEKNREIEKQKTEISEKASLLQEQTVRLKESNRVKSKLFSIISHDLKTPIFALRDVFRHAKEMNVSAEYIRAMVPEILDELNDSSILIENLLQWSKYQIHDNSIRKQIVEVGKLANEAVRALQLPANAKQLCIEKRITSPVYAYADRNMISIVLRNLLSNAIKFTPEKGHITICAGQSPFCTELYVQDSGKGISREEIKKINAGIFYTTRGTGNENGTGLGLMLCREFISKNDGCLMIESEPGRGSKFSCTLPLPAEFEQEVATDFF